MKDTMRASAHGEEGGQRQQRDAHLLVPEEAMVQLDECMDGHMPEAKQLACRAQAHRWADAERPVFWLETAV